MPDLGDSLTKKDCKVVFICQMLLGNLCDMVEEKGFQCLRIEAFSDWDKYNDAQATIASIRCLSDPIDWLVIDHYQIDRKWEYLVRSSVSKIMVIDDLANRLHDCDLLLDQNPYYNFATRYKKLVPLSCLQLLGLDYLMLRQEFRDKSEQSIKKSAIATHLLITMGGSDAQNITCWLLEILDRIQISLSIKIAVGSGCPHFDKIKTITSAIGSHQVTVARQVANISDWMTWADLAICAGGFTSYELAFMGVPTLVISASLTQLEAAITLDKLGINKFLGEFKTLSIDNVVEVLNTMIFDSKQRVEMSQNAKTKIDGYGVERVVNKILNTGYSLCS